METPRFAPLTLAGLSSYHRALEDAGAGYLFIDTAPSIGGVNPDLFAIADLILIPLNPTPTDLRALVKGLPVIKNPASGFISCCHACGRTFVTMTTSRWPSMSSGLVSRLVCMNG